MIRSLRTAVTGLKSHQVRMDVVGNNIANVNSIGFKRGRTAFNEVLGQKLFSASRAAGGQSINSSFIGFGVGVGAINQNWNQGALENTNIATDLALNGDGFFVVNNGGRTMLTRAGNFAFDDQGRLVTSAGVNVQGYSVDGDGNVDTSAFRDVTIDFSVQAPPRVTENVTVAGNLPSDAVEGDVFDISTVIYDEQGRAHSVILSFTKTATANEWDYEAKYNGDLTPEPFAAETGTITFNVDGTLTSPAPIEPTFDTNYVTAGSTFAIGLDGLTQYSGSTTVAVQDQDGYGRGQVIGYYIDSDGMVALNFSNGEQQALYQLAIATVNNPNGLENLGENFYGLTSESGDPIYGRAGQEIQTAVVEGFLEMSNVDLATEFTDMIVAQRGYQASARVITTSDELLQETVNLKR